MAFFRGQQGTVYFDKDSGTVQNLGQIAAVRSWSLTVDKEPLEVTDHGDTSRHYVGGLISGSGSCEVLYDAPSGDKLDLLKEALVATDPANANFELYLDEESEKKISFKALVTGAEYSATVGELEVITVNFVANGNITASI